MFPNLTPNDITTTSKNINPVLVFFILVQIVFVVFVIITIFNLSQPIDNRPNITIENNSFDILDLSALQEESIQKSLYNTVNLNVSDVGNISNSGAIVREQSTIHQYFPKANVHYNYAIIDLPLLKQTYQMAYIWSDDIANPYVPPNRSIAILCPEKTQLIYDDFSCRDHFQNLGENAVVSNIMKFYTFDNMNVTTSSSGSNLVFSVYLPNDTYDANDAIAQLKQFIESLGFNPKEYTYEKPVYGYSNNLNTVEQKSK